MKNIHSKAFMLLLLLLAAVPVTAQQKFHIVSFDESPLDMTARDAQHEKIDGNGDRFAIVKVTSTSADDDLRAYNFDFGYMESLVESKGSELWVYVQRNAKHVTITRSGYHAVSKYDLRTTIQPGCVYVMQLSPEAKAASMQFLMFEVSPADSKAIIMFTDISSGGEEKLFGAIDIEGCAAKKLRLGEYSYRVVSENYHESEGRIVLSTNNGKHIEQVTLRPNFARITLNVSLDADIYVNDEKKGTGTWNGILTSGTYSIECRKEKHKSSFETITVEEGKDVTYTLKAPEPITGVLSLFSSPLRAAITIDGKPAGETPSIVENLLIGEHKVTLSKNGYKSATIDVIIKENETTEHNVTLQPGEEKQPVTPSQGGNVVSKPRDPNELLCIACANKNDSSIAYFTGGQWEALAANEKSRYAQLGVSIKENGHEFIIAAKDCQDPEDGDYELKFSGCGIDFAGVKNYGSSYIVREAYITTGYSDTKAIIEQTKGKTDSDGIKGAPAAEAAWNYKANSHDSLQWYLPSYSELYMIYMNIGKINSFLNKYFTDYNIISEKCYWSSTECDRSVFWYVNMTYGYTNYGVYNRNISYRVRAVASIKENETTEHNVTLQPGEDKQPVTPSQGGSSDTINGHEYVDLGLPSGLLWATCNVGANAPEENGDYYAWGETKTKSSYTKENSRTYGKSNIPSNISGNPEYDAARKNWGSSWRMPTKKEFEELRKKCIWTWTSQNGKNGYKVTSKKNGNSIFLPASGLRNATSHYHLGSYGYYWSANPDVKGSTEHASGLYFGNRGYNIDWNFRYYSRPIRPVSK